MKYWIAYGFVLLLSLTALVLSINPYDWEYVIHSPIVSEIDTLRGPTGSVIIYYVDGQMNAGRGFYQPRIDGSFIIFEGPEQIRIVPFIQILEVYWYPEGSFSGQPNQSEPYTFPPIQKEGA